MNSSYKTQGVVIKRMNYGEADRILTIFTERFGKIKVIAKGVRKTKSKLAGSLEPFMLVDLQLHEGKTFFTVTGTSIVREFPKIHDDLSKTSKVYYLAELLDRFTEETQPQKNIFELFLMTLETVEQEADLLAVEVFQLKLIEAAGFKPQLYECVHCKERLTPLNNFWDAVEGGVICLSCQTKFRRGSSVSDNAIKILRLIEGQVGARNNLKLSQDLSTELQVILEKYIENIVEREIKSEKFMKEVSEGLV